MSAHNSKIIFEGLMLSIRLAIALMITDRLSSDTIRQYGQVLYQGETFTRNEVMYPQGAHRILYQILHYMRMMLLKQAILIHIWPRKKNRLRNPYYEHMRNMHMYHLQVRKCQRGAHQHVCLKTLSESEGFGEQSRPADLCSRVLLWRGESLQGTQTLPRLQQQACGRHCTATLSRASLYSRRRLQDGFISWAVYS